MKAIVLRRYGGPDDLRLEEVATPEPRDDEVRVRVHTSAVNDWDWGYVRGKPYVYRLLFGLTRPRVRILGAEVAGVVDAVGSKAHHFRVGDAVYGDISEAGFGGFAEFVCVRESALARKPDTMSFEQAAALSHAGNLAVQGLIDVGRLQAGDRVLINGAGGGVGTLGLQIARQWAAAVTGVDHARKLDMLTALGFDHVIDYQQEDFTRNAAGYDLILDTRSDRSLFRYLHALRPGGRYVTVGGRTAPLLQVATLGPIVERVTGKRARVVALKTNKDLETLHRLFETEGLESRIDGPYPLHEVPQAVQRFGEARHGGKVIIQVTP